MIYLRKYTKQIKRFLCLKVVIIVVIFTMICILNVMILETTKKGLDLSRGLTKLNHSYGLVFLDQRELYSMAVSEKNQVLNELENIDEITMTYNVRYVDIDGKETVVMNKDYFDYLGLSITGDGEVNKGCVYLSANHNEQIKTYYLNENELQVCGVLEPMSFYLVNESMNYSTEDNNIFVQKSVIEDDYRDTYIYESSDLNFIIDENLNLTKDQLLDMADDVKRKVEESFNKIGYQPKIMIKDNSSFYLTMGKYNDEYWQSTKLETMSLVSLLIVAITLVSLYENLRVKRYNMIVLALGKRKFYIFCSNIILNALVILISLFLTSILLGLLKIAIVYEILILAGAFVFIVQTVIQFFILSSYDNNELIKELGKRRV